MPIRFKPTSAIIFDLGIEKNGRVQTYLANTLTRYMEKQVPKGDTKMLSTVVTTTPNSITYEMPYAHYIYIGKLYVDPLTRSSWARKGTKKVPTDKNLTIKNGYSYWDKVTLGLYRHDIEKEVQQYAKRSIKKWMKIWELKK